MPSLLTWPIASAAASAGAACRAAAAAAAPAASCCGRCTALHATRLRVEGLTHVWGVRRPVHCGAGAVLRRVSGAATLGGAVSEPREFVECVAANRGGFGRQVGRVGGSQVGFGPHLRSGLHICNRLPAAVPSDRNAAPQQQSAAWISLADRHLPGHGRHARCNGAFKFEPFSMAQPSCIVQAVTSHEETSKCRRQGEARLAL